MDQEVARAVSLQSQRQIGPAADDEDICIQALSLAFDNRAVFRDFNLRLASGKWNVLLGRSGVGKSSLLKAIAGLLPQESYQGNIHLSEDCDLQGKISWMTQDDLLLPWLSILDNVLIRNRLRSTKHPQANIERKDATDLLKHLGLGAALHQKPRTLSGGMRQRTALARTLLEDRPIVLLDEPFSALDAITRAEMQELTSRYLRGKTVVMITHDPLEALRLAEVIYVLKGPIVTAAKPLIPQTSPIRNINSPEVIELYSTLISELSQSEGFAQSEEDVR